MTDLAVPLRLRYHTWRRGGRPTLLVFGRYFARQATSDYRIVTLFVDGEVAGRHVSPAISSYRGTIMITKSDPLYVELAPGRHRISLQGGDVELWRTDVELDRGETIRIWFTPERAGLLTRSVVPAEWNVDVVRQPS